MPVDPDQRPTRPACPGRSRLLCCTVCGRAEARSPDDLLLYTRHGWPECCGQVMSYFVLPPEPTDDDPPAG